MKNFKKYHFTNMLITFLLAFTFYSCSEDPFTDEEILGEESLIEANATRRTKQGIVITKTKEVNAKTFAKILIDAVRKAGKGGTVILADGTYRTDRPIKLPATQNVTIRGRSNRNKVKIIASKFFKAPGIISCGGNGTVFRNITVDWAGRNGISAAINTNGHDNCKAFNMRFKDAGYGFGTPDDGNGKPINGLVAENCEFVNCRRGIAFIRYFSKTEVRKMNKITIRNCQFKGANQIVGVSFDAGNDGSDGRPNLRGKKGAKAAKGAVLDLRGTLITKCTFEPTSNFNIALAKVKNLVILDNVLNGSKIKGAVKNSEAINIEHESNNIVIRNNRIKNDATNGKHAFISIVTFRDYGNAPLHENGCRNIRIINNQFSGKCRSGIIGEDAENIFFKDNKFRGNLKNRPLDIDFFKEKRGGNRNIKIQSGNVVFFNKNKGTKLPKRRYKIQLL